MSSVRLKSFHTEHTELRDLCVNLISRHRGHREIRSSCLYILALSKRSIFVRVDVGMDMRVRVRFTAVMNVPMDVNQIGLFQ